MTTQLELTKELNYNWDFRAMDVVAPPKYVNEDLNSQFGIKGQYSHIEWSEGSPYIHRYYGCCTHVSKDEPDAYDKYA